MKERFPVKESALEPEKEKEATLKDMGSKFGRLFKALSLSALMMLKTEIGTAQEKAPKLELLKSEVRKIESVVKTSPDKIMDLVIDNQPVKSYEKNIGGCEIETDKRGMFVRFLGSDEKQGAYYIYFFDRHSDGLLDGVMSVKGEISPEQKLFFQMDIARDLGDNPDSIDYLKFLKKADEASPAPHTHRIKNLYNISHLDKRVYNIDFNNGDIKGKPYTADVKELMQKSYSEVLEGISANIPSDK